MVKSRLKVVSPFCKTSQVSWKEITSVWLKMTGHNSKLWNRWTHSNIAMFHWIFFTVLCLKPMYSFGKLNSENKNYKISNGLCLYSFMNSKSAVNCFVWNHHYLEKCAKKVTIIGMPPILRRFDVVFTFQVSEVRMLHFLKDWYKFIQFHQYYTMVLKHQVDGLRKQWKREASVHFLYTYMYMFFKFTRMHWDLKLSMYS